LKPYEPRLSDETKALAIREVERLHPEQNGEDFVDAVVAVVWPKMLGDCRDRVATVLHAARALVEAEEAKTPAEDICAKRRGLQRALDACEHPAAWPPGASGPVQRIPTREEIERGRPTKAQLAEWGIAWPPPRGWKRRLLAAADAEANRGS